MNKIFNSNNERYRTIRKLCKIDLEHSRKLESIYKAFDSIKNIKGVGSIDAIFIFEMFHVNELAEVILDLLNIPKNNINYDPNEMDECPEDYFCRDYYMDIWRTYTESEDNLDDDILIDSFIDVMEREVMELDIKTLNK